MTDNSFQHFPIGNDSINTVARPPAAAEAMQPSRPSSVPPLQSYMFEFGSDGNTYSVSFEGHLSHEDARLMLEAMHQALYADCGSVMHSYLEEHNIPYSGFRADMYPLNHQEIMDRAGHLLRSCGPAGFDSRTGMADNYYAVMDQQARTPDGGCEGCYYAVRKSADNGSFHYRIVGQTYACSGTGDTGQGYFAVRTGGGGRKFRDLDAVSGEPVLPAFGCVDIIGILIDIDHITDSGQAGKTAVK